MVIEQISADMKTAMMNKDADKLAVIRLIRAEFLKAEKEKGETLTEDRAMAILQSMIKQRRDSVTQYNAANRADLATKEEAEMVIISAYLPAALTEKEIDRIISNTLDALAPIDTRQTGKVIGAVMGKLKATCKPYDAKLANDKVKAKLS